MRSVRLSLVVLALLACYALAQQDSRSAAHASPADSMQTKLDWIQANAARNPPDSRVTEFSEEEINDYVAKEVDLPKGVQSVHLTSTTGVIHGHALVNFDDVTAHAKMNPLLQEMFSGVHAIDATADAYGTGGTAKVHVETVSIDGVDVPMSLVQMFVNRYVTPKYPNVGIDSQFKMPERVDQATVGEQKLLIVQK